LRRQKRLLQETRARPVGLGQIVDGVRIAAHQQHAQVRILVHQLAGDVLATGAIQRQVGHQQVKARVGLAKGFDGRFHFGERNGRKALAAQKTFQQGQQGALIVQNQHPALGGGRRAGGGARNGFYQSCMGSSSGE